MSGTPFELNNLVVRAGAGAGKTTNLTETVVEVADLFYQENQRLPKMIVSTFTRKATEELRERITTEIFDSNKPELLELVASKQQLHVSTIHGVLSLFLRQFGHLMGLEAGFRVADNEASYQMAKAVLHEIVPNFQSSQLLMENYSFEQVLDILLLRRRHKVECPELKAFGIAEQMAAAQELVGPAVDQFKKCLEAICIETDKAPWKDYAGYLISTLAELEKSKDAGWALEKIKAFGRKPSYLKKSPPFSENLKIELDKHSKAFESLAKKHGLRPQSFPLFGELANTFDELGVEFDKTLKDRKYSSGQLDSEDLELFSLQILRSEPELGKAFALQWDYWLVDEYQDTSPLQVEIMSKLRGDRPVYLVGDPQQSIYLFRGARVEVFEKEEKRILASGGEKLDLLKNYRSRPELLMAINDIVGDLGEGFQPMEPREEVSGSEAEVLRLLRTDVDSEDPYQGIINFVVEKLEIGASLDDFCVLARANSTLLDVARALEGAGLSVSVHAASGFYSRRETIDLLSLLKFLVNPHDNVNLVRLLKSPWFRISDIQIANLNTKASVSHWIRLGEICADEPSVKALKTALSDADRRGYIDSFRRLVFESGIVDFSHWHDSTGRRESNIWKLITDLRSQERSTGFNPVTVFRKFERALKKLDDESDAVASKEPNRINLMTVHKSKGLKFKYVILPNMEKSARLAKSRGHESVFVNSEESVGWSPVAPLGEGGEMKHSAAAILALEQISIREQEESLRLLYVAVTRAQEGICFHAKCSEAKAFSKDSWAGGLSCWALPAGEHDKSNYRISVQESPYKSLSYLVSKAGSGDAVREGFEASPGKAQRLRFSVTSLVEEIAAKATGSDSFSQSFDQIASSIRAPSVGSIVHGVFERIRYDEKFDYKTFLTQSLGSSASNYIEGTDYVLEMAEPPMAQLIREGNVEWGFQVKATKGILEGQIDLWAHCDGEVWVIDYKSGSPKHIEKAFKQLKYYAWALQKAFGYKDFKLAVVYPLSKQVKVRDLNNFEDIIL